MFSSKRFAAIAIIFFSAGLNARTFAVYPSIAGSFPSSVTNVASASTKCHAGLSNRALLLECTSRRGPRPHFSPLDTNSNSITPFAPRNVVTDPSMSCAANGIVTPTHFRSASRT